ncbi:unnamed protein product [Heterobilharzia americana]|nr:unnamed protein product [Heterobilharzia americana]
MKTRRNQYSSLSRSNSTHEEIQERGNHPFYRLLKEFPKLGLDEHEERVLQKKALSVIKQFSDSFTTDLPSIDILNHGPPNSQLQNIEESQRRRLTQLMRHDRQVDHLRQQRASEAVERRMRAEARERKFQLVRVQKYFDEFVREFRLKKLGKINADEQIFRRFFQQFIQRQKEYLCEIRKTGT